MVAISLFELGSVGAIGVFMGSFVAPEKIFDSSVYINLREITNWGFFDDKRTVLFLLSVLIALMVLCKNFFMALLLRLSTSYSVKNQEYFGTIIHRGIIYAPYSWYIEKDPTDLIQAVSWRSHLGEYLRILLEAMRDFMIISLLLISVVFLQPLVSMVVIVLLVGFSFLILRGIKKKATHYNKETKVYRRACNHEQRLIRTGYKDIKVNSKELYFEKSFKKNVKKFSFNFVGQQFYKKLPQFLIETVLFVSITLILFFLFFVMDYTMQTALGYMAVFGVAAWKMLPKVKKFLTAYSNSRVHLPYIDHVLEVYKEVRKFHKHYSGIDTKSEEHFFETSIELRNISFRYKTRNDYALRDISFTIDKNAMVGFVGLSGSGKSTLIDILSGILEPDHGHILIDGGDGSLYNNALFRDRLGYVNQSPYIMDGTLLENIAYGYKKPDVGKALEVCRMASVDFLDELGNGLNTHVGGEGRTFSGGQEQRVAIARALYRDPELLIMDEATSALDEINEKAIQESVSGLKGSMTILMVAHRLTSLEPCNYIVWIEKGYVKKVGQPSSILPEYRQYMAEADVQE